MTQDEASALPIVLDTNLFVAAGFNPRSASAEILAAVRQGRLRMIWSEPVRHEIERMLTRIPRLSYGEVEAIFRDEDRFDGPLEPERFLHVPDPEDRKFAALAHAAGALLITNDEHLLGARGEPELAVLTPREFRYREIRAGR